MVMEDGKYSDKTFIDAMVPHHQSAVEMADVALQNAEHEEIKQLSRNIISTQRADICAVAASLVPGRISITFSTGPYDR